MSAIKIEAKFGPPTHDRSALSGTSRHTLEALYRHPIAHNLAWLDVFALFTALGSAGRIVLVGHGEGHSNAAQALLDDLKRHHPQVFQHVAREITADIGQMTDPQLLARARKALT